MRAVPANLLALILAAVAAGAQQRLADVDPRAFDPSPGSLPRAFAPLGNHVLFCAEAPSSMGLWRSDGTPGGTTRIAELIMPFDLDIVPIGTRAVFVAFGGNTLGLWSTDGTAAGTVQVRGGLAFVPERSDLFVRDGNTAWFVASTPQHGFEIWRTDGTAAGTVRVTDIAPGPLSSVPPASSLSRAALAAVGGLLYFVADDGVHGAEPWVTDGTAAGTRMIADLAPGSASSDPGTFTAWNGRVAFGARTGANFYQLWTTDGTAAGTTRVTPVWFQGHSVALGNLLIFSADDFVTGAEPWVSDGTAVGTRRLSDAWSGLQGSGPHAFTRIGGRVFFVANDGVHGGEPWVTDGTPAGTRMVRDLNPGIAGSGPREPIAVGSRIVFQAYSGAGTGSEPHVSDGTAAGTRLLADVAAGAKHSLPTRLAAIGNECWFAADDGVSGVEVWRADPTGTTAQQVADLGRDVFGSSPDAWIATGERAFFMADDGVHGREPWVTDGTPQGTGLWIDASPGPAGSPAAAALVRSDHVLWTLPGGLWRSDLRGAERHLVAPLADPGDELLAAGGLAWFRNGADLWSSDGTAAGTRLVNAFYIGPWRFVEAGGRPFFLAALARASHGGLWTSDGTAAGTVLLIPTQVGPGTHHVVGLAPLGDRLLVFSREPPLGLVLWSTDGTPAGTVRVVDVPLDFGGVWETSAAAIGGRLLFAAGGAATGVELWATDGTAAGTQPLLDIRSGFGGSDPRGLTLAADRVFFAADDGVHGTELWISDGTAAGTRRVADLASGAQSSEPDGITALGGGRHVVFTAWTAAAGREVWTSDGTAAGTRRLADVAPGSQSAGSTHFGRVGHVLLFDAADPVHGAEPWALPIGRTGAFVAEAIGSGCAGSSGTAPRLAATAAPVAGNAAFALRCTGARSNAVGVVLFVHRGLWLDLDDCVLTALPADVTVTVPTDVTGSVTLPIPVPNDPGLVGGLLRSQTLVLDPGAPLLGAFAASNALEIVIGR